MLISWQLFPWNKDILTLSGICNYFPPTNAYHNPLSDPTSFNIDDDVSEKEELGDGISFFYFIVDLLILNHQKFVAYSFSVIALKNQ